MTQVGLGDFSIKIHRVNPKKGIKKDEYTLYIYLWTMKM